MSDSQKTITELEEVTTRAIVLLKRMELDQDFNFAFIELGLIINILKSFREYVEFKQAQLSLKRK